MTSSHVRDLDAISASMSFQGDRVEIAYMSRGQRGQHLVFERVICFTEMSGAPGLVPIRPGGRTRRLGPIWTRFGTARKTLIRGGRPTRGPHVPLPNGDRS